MAASPSNPPLSERPSPQRMQCMEVWGGNQHVQRSFDMPGLRVWIYSQPYEAAAGGGDVYYISSCASGRITRMLLADVCGHGEAVSNIAIDLRDLMRRNVNLIKQTKFVRAMNRQFADQAEQGGFATAIVCTFFAPNRSLQICNAGHPSPVLYRQDAQRWTLLHQHEQATRGEGIVDTPLGLIEQADYSEFEMQLEPGDMLLCGSDALTEARDRTGQLLGSAGLLEIVTALDADQPEQLIPSLTDQIRAGNERNLSEDDSTVLLFQATGTGSTLKDNLLAPLRLLGSARDNTRLT